MENTSDLGLHFWDLDLFRWIFTGCWGGLGSDLWSMFGGVLDSFEYSVGGCLEGF